MLITAVPPKFPLAWAQNAGAPYVRNIPAASQIGIVAGAASLNDGFVPLNATQIAAGGVPPFEQDMNGILRQITLWCQWQQGGGAIFYDSSFATAIGGYAKGATLMSARVIGNYWMSIADNNTTDPDSFSSVNWVPAPGSIASGTFLWMPTSTVPWGYVPSNALTIGNASSNASWRPNDDTFFAYSFLWNNYSQSLCPTLTSAGVITPRGANAAADFAANKAIQTPDMRGSATIGVDNMASGGSTFLAGIPVVSGGTTVPGSLIGENLHQLSVAETPVIVPSGSIANGGITVTTSTGVSTVPVGSFQQAGNIAATASGSGVQVPVNVGTIAMSSTASSFSSATQAGSTFFGNAHGSSFSHNTVNRVWTGFWNIKL